MKRKKKYPPRLKWGRRRTTAKPDGSRKAPPSRQRVVWIIDKKQQQLNKNTNNCTIVASIDYLCSDSWLDFDFNVDYLHEVVEEVATKSWKRHSARDLTRPGQRPGEFIGCRLCRRPLRFDDSMFWWILIGNGGFGLEMEGLVHPQSGLLCGAALPGAFFSRKTWPSWKNMIFDDFQMIFHEHGPNLLLNRWTINETGILDPIEFGWVP